MNSEQLNSARLARWSQNGEARLTMEAAAEWLAEIGFCAFLPAVVTGASAAASFLEAVVGRPATVPSAGERQRARELLARMMDAPDGESVAVPLKFGPGLGEQPDSVASPEAFRYIYALRGNRDFKGGPAMVGKDKVTPLALHCWQAVQENGPLDLPSLQSILGRDITEPAIARALQELWSGLYVFPVLTAKGQPAKWEMLARRFPQRVAAGSATGHAEALSAMVSLYLHAEVAATEDEILAFLSHLAPQSKLREVIRGLSSMRQLELLDIGGRAHLALQGGLLPEMVTQLSEEQLAPQRADSESGAESEIEIEREPSQPPREFRPRSMESSGETGKFVPKQFVPKKFVARESGPKKFATKRFDVAASQSRPEKSGPSFRTRLGDERGSRPKRFDARAGEPGRRERSGPAAGGAGERGPGERARRWEKSGERPGTRPEARAFKSDRAFSADRASTRKPSFRPSESQSPGPKPWASKGASARGGDSKPWPKRSSFAGESDRGDRPKRWEKSSGPGSRTPGKPYGTKAGAYQSGGAKPWTTRAAAGTAGERDREERPKRWEKSAGGFGAKTAGRSFAKENRPYAAKSTGFKSGGGKPWASKGAESRVGPAKSYTARAGAKPGGKKPWSSRPSESAGFGDRPKRREEAEARAVEKPRGEAGAKPFWARNPRGGKGSAAAGRTNRPRTKAGAKAGGKKSGKRK